MKKYSLFLFLLIFEHILHLSQESNAHSIFMYNHIHAILGILQLIVALKILMFMTILLLDKKVLGVYKLIEHYIFHLVCPVMVNVHMLFMSIKKYKRAYYLIKIINLSAQQINIQINRALDHIP